MNPNDPLGPPSAFAPRAAAGTQQANPTRSLALDANNTTQRQRWQQVMEQSHCHDWFKEPPAAKPALLARPSAANAALRPELSAHAHSSGAFDSYANANTNANFANAHSTASGARLPTTTPTALSKASGGATRNMLAAQSQSHLPSSPALTPGNAYLKTHTAHASPNSQAPADVTLLADAQVSALLAHAMGSGGSSATTTNETHAVQVSWHWCSHDFNSKDSPTLIHNSTPNTSTNININININTSIHTNLNTNNDHTNAPSLGIAVWLGIPLARQPEIPLLTQQLRAALHTANIALISLVCNGERLFSLDQSQPES